MPVQVVNSSTKVYLAKFGPAKVFGREEVDKREQLSDTEAVAWFDRVWRTRFVSAMDRAQHCELESVLAKVPTASHIFISREAEHRELLVANCLFIAQLVDSDSCDQLWFIPSTSGDPRTLYVKFDTIEERRKFENIAQQLGWKDNELGLQLIRDFVAKIDRR